MEIFNSPFSLRDGFSIIGDQKPCGIFDLDLVPQKSLLANLADFVRPALLGKVHASQGDDDLKTLWEATLEDTR